MSSFDPMGWMWAEACERLARAERMERQFFRVARRSAHGVCWEPPVDIYETANALSLIIALPGVAPTDLRVEIHQGSVAVSGRRALPAMARNAVIHRLELPFGHFERQVELPPGRYRIEGSELANGCLHLDLQKLP